MNYTINGKKIFFPFVALTMLLNASEERKDQLKTSVEEQRVASGVKSLTRQGMIEQLGENYQSEAKEVFIQYISTLDQSYFNINFVDLVNKICKGSIHVSDTIKIMEIIKKIPPSNYNVFFDFYSEISNGMLNVNILEQLTKVDPKDYHDLSIFLDMLVDVGKTSGWKKSNLIDIAVMVKPKDYGKYLQIVTPLVSKVYARETLSLMYAIAQVPSENYSIYLEKVNSVIEKLGLSGFEVRSMVYYGLSFIPKEHYDDFLSFVEKINLQKRLIPFTMQSVAEVPPQNYNDFIAALNEIAGNNSDYRERVMFSLKRIKQKDFTSFIDTVKKISANMGSEFKVLIANILSVEDPADYHIYVEKFEKEGKLYSGPIRFRFITEIQRELDGKRDERLRSGY